MKHVALITGASSGIGRELASIHAEHGGDLVIVSRKLEDLEQVRDEIMRLHNVKVYCIAKDLSNPNSAHEIFQEIHEQGIKIDYLMNNAGFGGQGYFHLRELERDIDMISVNVISLTKLTRLFLPEFVRRGRGRILNTSSTAALMPGPLQAVYYASKAYVSSFSNALAGELFGTGVTVTALLPGATDTGFGKTSGMDKTNLFKKAIKPRSVAEDGYNAMMRGKLNIMSGVPIPLRMIISISKILPPKMVLQQIKKQQEILK